MREARRAPRIGDLFRLETSKGNAFFQYTHDTQSDGSLIRVLPGLYEGSPDLAKLVESSTLFYVFLPVAAALSKSLIFCVGEYPVPEHAKAFPLFRQHELSVPGKPRSWSLWDGQRSTPISELSEDQASLPIRSIVTPSLLAIRLAEGWTPNDELVVEPGVERRGPTSPRRHYIYFDDRAAAGRAEAQFRLRRLTAELRQSQDPKDGWLVLVTDDEREDATVIQHIASEFGGEYDGYDQSR